MSLVKPLLLELYLPFLPSLVFSRNQQKNVNNKTFYFHKCYIGWYFCWSDLLGSPTFYFDCDFLLSATLFFRPGLVSFSYNKIFSLLDKDVLVCICINKHIYFYIREGVKKPNSCGHVRKRGRGLNQPPLRK